MKRECDDKFDIAKRAKTATCAIRRSYAFERHVSLVRKCVLPTCQHAWTGVSGCLEVAAVVGVMGMRSNLIRKYPCQMSSVEPNCFVSVGSSRNSTGKSIAEFVVDVLGY